MSLSGPSGSSRPLGPRHDIALVDGELRDAARELRVGFEPTIAHTRCRAAAAFDDATPDARPAADEQYQPHERDTQSPPLWLRRALNDGLSSKAGSTLCVFCSDIENA